jgi:hypothetical protein
MVRIREFTSKVPTAKGAWWSTLNEELEMFGQPEAGFLEARTQYEAGKTPAIAAQIIAAERIELERITKEAKIPRLPNGQVDMDAVARNCNAALERLETAVDNLCTQMLRQAGDLIWVAHMVRQAVAERR